MKNAIVKWVLGKAKDYFIKNWKTTVTGVLGAVLVKYIPDPDMRNTVIAAVLLALGTFAKDGDTSGTTGQPRLAPAVVNQIAVDYNAEPIQGG